MRKIELFFLIKMLKSCLTAYLAMRGLPKPIRFMIIISAEPLICFYRACLKNCIYYAKAALNALLPANMNTYKRIAFYASPNLEMVKYLKEMGFDTRNAKKAACITGNAATIKLVNQWLSDKDILNLIAGGYIDIMRNHVSRVQMYDTQYLAYAIMRNQSEIFNEYSRVSRCRIIAVIKFDDESQLFHYYNRNSLLNKKDAFIIAKYAAYNGSVRLLNLASEFGIDDYGELALCAAEAGRTEILDYLFNFKPQVFAEAKDVILKYICKNGHLAALEYLIKTGTKFNSDAIKTAHTKILNRANFHLLDVFSRLELGN